MDKNINDHDRIIIGVREWAIQTAAGDFFVDTNLIEAIRKTRCAKPIIEMATALEEYVLGGIVSKEKTV